MHLIMLHGTGGPPPHVLATTMLTGLHLLYWFPSAANNNPSAWRTELAPDRFIPCQCLSRNLHWRHLLYGFSPNVNDWSTWRSAKHTNCCCRCMQNSVLYVR